MMQPLLLRTPPFLGINAAVATRLPEGQDTALLPPREDLFALLRATQVGGDFWTDAATQDAAIKAIVRPSKIEELPFFLKTLDHNERQAALWITPVFGKAWRRKLNAFVRREGGQWREPMNPWSVLKQAQKLVAHGDDEWVALARILQVPVQILSSGRFGGPTDTPAMQDAAVYRELGRAIYRNPFTGAPASIESVIEWLAQWRTTFAANHPIAVACGIAWWKRPEIGHFLWHPQRPLRIVRNPSTALAIARKAGGALAIWPSRVSPDLISQAHLQGVPLVRVEDGFVRSVGLGVDLVPPSSIVVDASGIHFDPAAASDLESLLRDTVFNPKLIARAKALRETILAAGISKYSTGTGGPTFIRDSTCRQRRLVLVPAQVEDDMSVLAGGGGLTSNLELLRRVRSLEPDAEIWFRPHPDVDAGHRKGDVPDEDVLIFADRIVRGGGIAPLLGRELIKRPIARKRVQQVGGRS